MELLDEIADGLNVLLKQKKLDSKKFQNIISKLSEYPEVRLWLIDFDFYNEFLLNESRERKEKQLMSQNYEAASEARLLEKVCLKLVRMRKYFKIEKSFFYPEENRLIYFYLGESRTALALREKLNNHKIKIITYNF